jgi:hypothetical protein
MTLSTISFVISILGVLPYIWNIYHGSVRPERTTWFVWSMILAIACCSYQRAGAQASLWFLMGDFVATTLIFLMSLLRGSGGGSLLDIVCLGIAICGLVVWQISQTPILSVTGALLADMTALVPTILKTLRSPMTEHASTYLASSVAALCGVLAVNQWDLLLIFYPFYLFLANFTTGIVILVSQYQVKILQKDSL